MIDIIDKKEIFMENRNLKLLMDETDFAVAKKLLTFPDPPLLNISQWRSALHVASQKSILGELTEVSIWNH